MLRRASSQRGWLRCVTFACSLILVAALMLAGVADIEAVMFWAFVAGDAVRTPLMRLARVRAMVTCAPPAVYGAARLASRWISL